MEKDDLGPVGETKPWYRSRTILGGALTALAVVGAFFGVKIDEATKAVILDQTEALIAAAVAITGALLTVYGRFKASKAIGSAAK